MQLTKKIETDIDYYENSFNDFEEVMIAFEGGIPNYSNGFIDEIFNYRELIKFFGKYIIKEENETKKAISDAWNEDLNDIRDEFSHVDSFRQFTLHSTFVSIHSMFEGRLLECIEILNKYKSKNIATRKNKKDNKKKNISNLNDGLKDIEFLLSGLVGEVPNLVVSENEDKRKFYSEIKNKITHSKCFLKQEENKLTDQIRLWNYLKLNYTEIGSFTHRFQIEKSQFLLDYISLIEHDLKLVFISVSKL